MNINKTASESRPDVLFNLYLSRLLLASYDNDKIIKIYGLFIRIKRFDSWTAVEKAQKQLNEELK